MIFPIGASSRADRNFWYARFDSEEFEQLYAAKADVLWPAAIRKGTVCLFRLSDDQQEKWAGVYEISIPIQIAADQGWEPTYVSTAKLLSRVIRNIRSEINWERDARKSLAHEYRRISRSLAGSVAMLKRLKLQPGEERPLSLILGDISRATNSITVLSSSLADGTGSHGFEDPRVLSAFLSLRDYDADPNKTLLDIKEIVNSVFFARRPDSDSSRIRVEFGNNYRHPTLKANEFSIYEVVGTLADNAFKYSLPGSELRIRIAEKDSRLYLTISNLGAEMSKPELQRRFSRGMRGEYAIREYPNDGKGFGLPYAKDIMGLLGGDLLHSQRDPQGAIRQHKGFNFVWHDFQLVVPRSRVVPSSMGGK